jgi:hypothetical protein
VYGANVVVFEGILALHDAELNALYDMRIFVDTDDDVRLARRRTGPTQVHCTHTHNAHCTHTHNAHCTHTYKTHYALPIRDHRSRQSDAESFCTQWSAISASEGAT